MRRLLVIAYEDIGLGNPQGAARAVSAVQAAERLGLPEARIPLANAIIELALHLNQTRLFAQSIVRCLMSEKVVRLVFQTT